MLYCNINYKLTGRLVTDYSYASGSGVYDLMGWDYSDTLIAASGLPRAIFPAIVPSTEVLGEFTQEATDALGLPQAVKVVADGVDNSCMALMYKMGVTRFGINVNASIQIIQECAKLPSGVIQV